MTVRLGVVMDPIGAIHYKKDSTLAMLLAASRRGWTLEYLEPQDLYVRDGIAWGRARPLTVYDDARRWHEWGHACRRPLGELDVILMRRDPPFDMEYIYCTYVLDLAQRDGALVVNGPQALRDVNEKMAVCQFPDLAPPTLVTRDAQALRDFTAEHGTAVVKPLDGMGGRGIFVLRDGDANAGVIIETALAGGERTAMAQRYLPEIDEGDKRILLIDGVPVDYALARIPPTGDHRGNLAVGGRAEGRALSTRDRQICTALAPMLRERGVLFAGIDVIGDYLTEINITSPTCIRELDDLYSLDVGSLLMDAIEARLNQQGG